MVDELNVQPGAVSGDQSPGAVPPVAPPAPSPEEIKIAEVVKRQVAEEIAKQSEVARREIQSVKDKARAEVEAAHRRARMAEVTSNAATTRLREVDPSAVSQVELEQYKAVDAERARLEAEEQAKQTQREFHDQFHSSLVEIVADLGIDAADTRIDWAEDAANYLEAQRRVLKSAAKLKKETDKSVEQRVKEEVAKARRELGLDSVDTTTSSGVSADGIPTDMGRFREWVAGLSQRDYEEKYAAKVDEMMKQGKIK